MKIIRLLLYSIIWLITAITEFSLLFAGLVSQGHDRFRLILIALAIVCLPVIAYLLHRAVRAIFSNTSSS